MSRLWPVAILGFLYVGPVVAQGDEIPFGPVTITPETGWMINLNDKGQLIFRNRPDDPDYNSISWWGISHRNRVPFQHLSAKVGVRGHDMKDKFIGVALYFGNGNAWSVALNIRPEGGVQVIQSSGGSLSSPCGSMSSSDYADNKLHRYDFKFANGSFTASVDGQDSMSCSVEGVGPFPTAGLMVAGPKGGQNAFVAGVYDLKLE